MKLRLSIFVGITFLLSYVAQAQIAVDNTLSAQELIEEYLLGEGVEVANITINGQSAETVNNQAGLYTGPSNVIDFDEGIVMVTGDAQTAAGGLGSPLTHPISSDLDLMAIAGQNINEAIIIEFDFLASRDSIKFNYVFASKEYPSFTCSQFNDVFGFFLSGAGIDGPFSNNAKNIALIPGTEVPVGINTVNSGVPTGGPASNCFDANPDWVEHSQYFVSNSSNPIDDVQFPGMTQTFTAMSEVQCGEWYHIKLAIGDAVDTGWNSAVFLEAGSFAGFGDVFLSLTPQIGGEPVTNPLYDDVLVAGCSEAYIELTRPKGMSADSVFVEFGGTATIDVDYIFDDIDTLFFFPNGIDTIGFTLTTLWDGVGGNDKYLTVYIHYQDGCGSLKTDSASIDIVDPYFLSSSVQNVVNFCPTDQVLVSAEGLEGIEPYTYDWGDYGQGEELNEVWVDVLPEDSTYYQVSISDICAFENKLDSVLVINNISDPLQAVIDPFTDPTCSNEPIDLHASINDGNGEYTIIWGDGKDSGYPAEEDITVFNINETINFTPDPVNFTYDLPVYLTVIDTCGTIVRDTVNINYPFIEPLKAGFSSLTEQCPADPITITANAKNGTGDFNYDWGISKGKGKFVDGADVTASSILAVPAGGINEYTLSVTDNCGRDGMDFQYIIDNEIFRSGSDMYADSVNVIKLDNIMNVITPNGDNKNDYFVVEGIYEFDDARLEVYDRWGKMIYETDNYRAGLENPKPDDVFDADGFEDGTYFYVINVNSGECVQSGTIEVLRGNN